MGEVIVGAVSAYFTIGWIAAIVIGFAHESLTQAIAAFFAWPFIAFMYVMRGLREIAENF